MCARGSEWAAECRLAQMAPLSLIGRRSGATVPLPCSARSLVDGLAAQVVQAQARMRTSEQANALAGSQASRPAGRHASPRHGLGLHEIPQARL